MRAGPQGVACQGCGVPVDHPGTPLAWPATVVCRVGGCPGGPQGSLRPRLWGWSGLLTGRTSWGTPL
jgi:hypothetical protein